MRIAIILAFAVDMYGASLSTYLFDRSSPVRMCRLILGTDWVECKNGFCFSDSELSQYRCDDATMAAISHLYATQVEFIGAGRLQAERDFPPTYDEFLASHKKFYGEYRVVFGPSRLGESLKALLAALRLLVNVPGVASATRIAYNNKFSRLPPLASTIDDGPKKSAFKKAALSLDKSSFPTEVLDAAVRLTEAEQEITEGENKSAIDIAKIFLTRLKNISVKLVAQQAAALPPPPSK